MARRGAPLAVLDDTSPLTGDRIQVGVRTGWVLRTARLTGAPGAGPVARLADMAARLAEHGVRTSPATLHRLETGALRDGRLVEGYESVLGLPHGSLRAPLDAFARTFPYGPADRAGVGSMSGAVTSVAEMDALVEPLLAHPHGTDGPAPVDGSAWLRWARALAAPNALGLPSVVAAPLVRRLASELGRAQGPGFLTRYEALSLLRRSAYGGLVLGAAQDVVGAPHVQVLLDLMSAVGESDDHDAAGWLVSLLEDPRDLVVAGAVLGLENLAATSGGAGGESLWPRVADPLVSAYDARASGTEAWRFLSHLVRLLPAATREVVEARLSHPLADAPVVPVWTRNRLNEHWSTCEALAARTTDPLGLAEQPLLARMLLEIATGEEETRAVTSGMLLSALPAVVGGVVEGLAELADTHADPVVGERTARRLAGMLVPLMPDRVRAWALAPGPRQATGLKIAGTAGVRLPEPVLRAAASGGDPHLRRHALHAAGMTDHPLLRSLSARSDVRSDVQPAAPAGARRDDEVSHEVVGGARWWLAEGSRVPA